MQFNRVFGDSAIFEQEAKVVKMVEQRKPDRQVEKVRKNIHNGHKLYECDMRTGILDEVVYKSKGKHFVTGLEEFVYMEKSWCIYIPALNEANALKKLGKIMKKNFNTNVNELK